MIESPITDKILSHLKSQEYRPRPDRKLARELDLHDDQTYPAFRDALRELMHAGRVVMGAGGVIMLPTERAASNEITGVYRQNRRGFGFVCPTDPSSHEDLYIPQGENFNALTGDIVKARITNQHQRDGKVMYHGRITSILQRTQKRFVGSIQKRGNQWFVLPDGNTLIEPILVPDAATRQIPPSAKVVVELTSYGDGVKPPQGVITEVLGQAGEKDVDLRSVIVQFDLPREFSRESLDEARAAVDRFGAHKGGWPDRLELDSRTICTIDPDDSRDFDDAISLRRLDNGLWELGVHIADVSYFVPPDSALDEESKKRGNSVYFPGYVIPMLPEVLSNGVCSLQENVPRLCKSAFVTFDEHGQAVGSSFANTLIRSAARLRYREAQALIDGQAMIPHPAGARPISQYNPAVVELLHQMNTLARAIQKRRLAAGQIVLNLPEVDLVLDENGKVVGTKAEDQSFTHTLIEMFMVEANEAVARLLDSIGVPFLRRIHPEPELANAERLRQFAQVSGHKVPKLMDRKSLQALLASVVGKPEAFAINLAVLKSLTRAEYAPKVVGHYALASEHYCHFTSPIRRYADLTIHRLLDAYFQAGGGLRPGRAAHGAASHSGGRQRNKIPIEAVVPTDALTELGRHLSFTERRGDDAERELRKIKLLELLSDRVGDDFQAVVTGITQFGIFVQIQEYLIDGVIRFEDLMDDWWQIDEKSGLVRGQRTGRTIRIGDLCVARVVRVDVPRRDLGLSITEHLGRPGKAATALPALSPGIGQQGLHPRGKKSAAQHEAKSGRGKKSPKQKDLPRGGGPGRGKSKRHTGRRRGR